MTDHGEPSPLPTGELRTVVHVDLSQLVSDIGRLARGVERFADQLVETNNRVDELRSLRRRNAILSVAGLVLAVAVGFGTWLVVDRFTELLDTVAECTSPAEG